MIIDASALALVSMHSLAQDAQRLRFEALLRHVIQVDLTQAPILAQYELGNTFHRKRLKEILGTTLDRFERVRRALQWVRLRVSELDELFEAARISEAAGTSFYDAAYIALARLVARPLITADHGQAAHARAQGVETYVVPDELGELERRYGLAPAD